MNANSSYTAAGPLAAQPHRLTTAYVWVMVAAGALALGQAGLAVAQASYPPDWLVLATATVISGAATLRIRSTNVSISVSEVFVFSALVLFGPAAATVCVALDALVISIRIGPGRKLGLPMFLFNITAPALAMFATGTLLYGRLWQPEDRPGELGRLLMLCATTSAYFMAGTGAVATLLALQQRASPIGVWRRTMPGLWPSYAAGTYAAAVAILFGPGLDWRLLAMLVPFPAILYLAFRSSIGRLDDQVRHLEETNRAYQRMAAALAHAVDAKDQTTYGHIQRVQNLCERLAREVGVGDADQLRAIRAAALLHDLGKIVVPESILNKPGPLTPSEFDRMKRHVTAGAAILSEVQFPYPLVPIVRHHHENWDGSGYPDGLRGEEIPLGARILAVVDCYDALTSDRPYRRALQPAAALAILRDRSGTMYDPAIVEGFLRMQSVRELAIHSADSRVSRRSPVPAVARE